MIGEGQRKISVVVPCYKTEASLPGCLDSLVNQDMDDYEVICVNDGSPDGCRGIMRDYEQRYPQKVRCVDRENGGLWNARLSGIDVACGEYITFVDSDDTVTPDFLSALYGAAKRSGADIVVCGFSRVDLETGRVLSKELCQERPPFRAKEDPGRIIEVNPAAWNKAYRADLLGRTRRLAETPAIMEDLALVLLAYPETEGPVVFVPKSLVNYMVHADSMINTVTSEQVETVKRMLLEVRERYLEEDVGAGLRKALDAVAFVHLGVSMGFRLLNAPGVKIREAIGNNTAFLDEFFPSWRHSPYISLGYALRRGPAHKKLLIAQRIYRMHLMVPFLAAYRFVLNRLKIDIKW